MFISLIRKISQFGISGEDNRVEKTQIRLINYLSLLGLFITVSTIILNSFDNVSFGLGQFFSLLCCILPISLNFFGKFEFSKFFICGLVPLWILDRKMAYGPESEMDLILIVLIILVVFFYKNIVIRILSIAWITLIYILGCYLTKDLGYYDNPIVSLTIKTLMMLGVTFSAMTISYMFYKSALEEYKEKLKFAEISKHKDNLLTILAHDMKGPILSFDRLSEKITFLMDLRDFDSVEKLSKAIKINVRQLKETVYKLLEWASSQKDEFILHFKNINIAESCESIKGELDFLLNDKNIKLNIENNATSEANLDADALTIILRNIFHNSIDASEMGQEINVTISEKHNQLIEIEIRDFGKGFRRDMLKKLNGYSHGQVLVPTNRMRGIGLSTSLAFIYQNGGTYFVENIKSGGSRQLITFPKYINQ